MGGKVKGDGKPFLPGGEVAAVKGVGLFGGRETGVLTNGPRLRGIHGGARATHVRRQAGKGARDFQIIEVFFGVQRLDGNPFRRLSFQRLDGFFPATEFFIGECLPLLHVCHFLLRITQ